jgi:chromosomal replication initiator protein
MMEEVLEKEVSTNNNSSHWDAVVYDLRHEYGEDTYKSWISKAIFNRIEGGCLYIAVPTRFIRDWLVTHFERKIIRMWQKYNDKVIKLHVNIENVQTSDVTEKKAKAVPVGVKEKITTFLDKRFTFDTFVVGPPNEFAYAAARAVSESQNPQPGSNPLFLYGGVGLGKTHLMHSIAWHINKNMPDRKVVYITAEKFMYQFIQSLRNNNVMSFKEQYRSADVLMVDDVQFICGKDSTQEEFFHTLNSLIDNNRQVIISADRSPSDLEQMEERIKSRLGWGLVADIHNTTYELRLGILETKISLQKTEIPSDVIEFLARKITSNVRELEGALNKVIAHTKLTGKSITLERTQDILSDLLRSNDRVVTIEDIQKKVAEHYGIKVSDMYSVRRVRTVSRPRQIAMYLAKLLTTKSLADIGRSFGGKDHTTVMHATRTIEELSKQKKEIAEDIKLLRKGLEC